MWIHADGKNSTNYFARMQAYLLKNNKPITGTENERDGDRNPVHHIRPVAGIFQYMSQKPNISL